MRLLSTLTKTQASFSSDLAYDSSLPIINHTKPGTATSGSMGFAKCKFIPAAALSMSSSNALAVMAIIGMVLASALLICRMFVMSETIHQRHPDIHQDRIIKARLRLAEHFNSAESVFSRVHGKSPVFQKDSHSVLMALSPQETGGDR